MVQTKEEKKQKQREYDRKRYPLIKEQKKKYNKKYKKEYYLINKEKLDKKNKDYNKNIKIQVFNLLGGCKCVICGDEELSHLTIDHIDNTGYLDKRKGLRDHSLYRAIVNNKLTKEQFLNLRVLCYNCNCGRRKEYLNIPYELQKVNHRYQTKLWKQTLEFFGPCRTCGDTDLVHLTVSHINNDGAEKRKNGERSGVELLKKFRKLSWPESLKEDFCLECFNCNCSRDKTKGSK